MYPLVWCIHRCYNVYIDEITNVYHNYMKKYYIYIQIYNDHGELYDKRFGVDSYEEIAHVLEKNAQFIQDEATTYGKENGMLYEELYDSKEDAEIAMDNGLLAEDFKNSN